MSLVRLIALLAVLGAGGHVPMWMLWGLIILAFMDVLADIDASLAIDAHRARLGLPPRD